MANTGLKVIVANDPNDLATQVTALAADGWLPQGAVSVVAANMGSPKFYLTLVKGDVGGAEGTGDVYTLPAAGASIGGVKIAAAQADSAAANLAAFLVEFNAFLAKLRTSGVLTP